MTEDNDDRVDWDGVVYEKNWSGHYEPKWDAWSQDYVRDNSAHENQPIDHSWDGTPLYRRHEPSTIRTSSSSSAGEGLLVLISAVVLIVIGVGVLILAVSPVVAPLLLSVTESARKRGDVTEEKKWNTWATIASIIAGIVAFLIASFVTATLFSRVVDYTNSFTSSIFVWLIYIFAFAVGVVIFALLFVTVFSPTVIVYLRNKESQLRSLGKELNADKIKEIYWITGITAAGTVIFSIMLFAAFTIYALARSYLSG